LFGSEGSLNKVKIGPDLMHGKFFINLIGVTSVKKYITISACGLSCELCPRYYTEGTSRCPGCGSEYRICVGCPIITCCVKGKGLETCAECTDFPCQKYTHVLRGEEYDSFVTHRKALPNLYFIKKHGIVAHARKIKERAKLLKQMLKKFNDRRSRSFYCVATTLLPIEALERSLNDAKKKVGEERIGSKDLKSCAKILKEVIDEVAKKEKVDLKLRKPPHWKK